MWTKENVSCVRLFSVHLSKVLFVTQLSLNNFSFNKVWSREIIIIVQLKVYGVWDYSYRHNLSLVSSCGVTLTPRLSSNILHLTPCLLLPRNLIPHLLVPCFTEIEGLKRVPGTESSLKGYRNRMTGVLVSLTQEILTPNIKWRRLTILIAMINGTIFSFQTRKTSKICNCQ